MNKTTHKAKIAIIGGGVAGSSAALYFGSLGLDVTLFEREPTLVTGPPFVIYTLVVTSTVRYRMLNASHCSNNL